MEQRVWQTRGDSEEEDQPARPHGSLYNHVKVAPLPCSHILPLPLSPPLAWRLLSLPLCLSPALSLFIAASRLVVLSSSTSFLSVPDAPHAVRWRCLGLES